MDRRVSLDLLFAEVRGCAGCGLEGGVSKGD